MQQRGRKSVAALSAPAGAVALIERPEPPLDLTPEESEVWRGVVEARAADWFDPPSWPLLRQFCRHTVLAGRFAQMVDAALSRDELDVAELKDLAAMQARETASLKAMAAALRISPQSMRTDRAANTAKGAGRTVKRPWE